MKWSEFSYYVSSEIKATTQMHQHLRWIRFWEINSYIHILASSHWDWKKQEENHSEIQNCKDTHIFIFPE